MTELVQPLLVSTDGDARQRGLQRGRECREQVAACWEVYLRLFAAHGLVPGQLRDAGLAALDAVADWAPDLADEMVGTAEGAGLEGWHVGALNARTEILSLSTRARPGECSTVVSTRTPVVSMQTWDWHAELAGSWHLQRVTTATGTFVGLTEHGILAKIGVNDAGVGVHLNVLGHRDDAPGAVPVHVAAAQVLHAATSADHAVELLVGAPVRTSSAVTVVTETAAVTVELSPAGAEVVRSDEHHLLHTNHFLAPRLAEGERSELYQPDSSQRLDLLGARCAARFEPQDALDLLPYLSSVPGDPAELCCIPAPTAQLGDRWATLATVALRPGDRTMLVAAGSPVQAAADGFRALTAG